MWEIVLSYNSLLPAKIIKIQPCIQELQLKMLGILFYETQCISYFRVSGVGLPDLPGDAVFQTLSPASGGGKPPGRTNLPYSVGQIVASLRRHCDT